MLLFVCCADINECLDGTDECDENADCIDTEGSYTCTCRRGYAGDGFTCIGEYMYYIYQYIAHTVLNCIYNGSYKNYSIPLHECV